MKTQTTVFKQDNKEVIQEGNKFFTRVLEEDEYFESQDFNTFEAAKKHLGIKPTITDNNKLIAEFMRAVYMSHINKWFVMNEECIDEELKYNSDWNWLMEVVEKIENLGFDFAIYTGSSVSIVNTKDFPFEEVISLSGSSKKEAVYNAVVAFIEWYNSAEKE